MPIKLVNLNRINGYLIVFVLFTILSCTVTTKIPEDQLLIRMEKTPCYGKCPVYTLSIGQDGRGVFEGKENTDYTGLYTFRLRRAQIDELHEAFERAGFFSMEDKYHAYVTDLPTVYLTYRSGGKEKKIMDYYGAPQELKDLENQVETLVLSLKLKKIE
jgi:hypothetical protein